MIENGWLPPWTTKAARARVSGWLEVQPADASLQVLAARVDLAGKDGPAAERRLMDVIRGNPDRLEAYELLASLYLQQGNQSAALEKYRELAARAPDAPGPATVVGMLQDASGDRAGARAQYESVLARHPRAAVAANNLAWMLADEGRHDEALRWARVAVDVLRGRPEPHDTLGWVYLKKNQPVDALAAFEMALAVAPQSRVYQEHRAAAKAMIAGGNK